jgi:hypothetical protein
MMGMQNDLSGVGVRGIAESVAQVIPMPSAAVMDTLIRALENH